MPRRRRATICGAVVALVAVSACSGSPNRASPSTRPRAPAGSSAITPSGYVIPAPLPPGAAGSLIAERTDPGAQTLLGAARAWRVLFHSVDLSGRDIAVSGLVLLPHGSAPAGGWPVVAWAHGTTGLADQCAPSLAPRLGADASAVLEVRALLAQGLAVVASDYPGLGTPGVHPYLIGAADADSVIDSVSAAHALAGVHLSRAWVTVGHSEGGQTALFVAEAPVARLSRWQFLGTVALAPASHLDLIIPLAEAEHDPVEQAYTLYALEGLSTVDPSVHLNQLLTPQTRGVSSDFTTGCIDAIVNDLRRAHISRLLAAPSTEVAELRSRLGHFDDPGQHVAHGPVLIVQGTADNDVPAIASDLLAQTMCKLGDRLDYQHYPGRDHAGVVPASFPRVHDWITARLRGEIAPTTCH